MKESDWKRICLEIGTYHTPLHEIRKEYHNLSVALRFFCKHKEIIDKIK